VHRVARCLVVAAASFATAAMAVLGASGTALADGYGTVQCDLNPTAPECTAKVRSGSGGGGRAARSVGAPVCTFQGETVECADAFGWYGDGGCYYGKDPGGFLPAQQWIKSCIDPATGNVNRVGVVLLLSPPVSLETVVRQAMSRLRIPRPTIAASPDLTADQVVQVPVWWWVEPGVWQPRSATAAVPGIAITVTATPKRIVWDAGDGTSTTCTGPGTPWTATYVPTADSPTCGHRYVTTSRTAPGGDFTVRASMTWSIAWAGGGLSGTEPDVTTTATAQVRVTELRAVITG